MSSLTIQTGWIASEIQFAGCNGSIIIPRVRAWSSHGAHSDLGLLADDDATIGLANKLVCRDRPAPKRFALSAPAKATQMPKVTQSGAGGIADAMRDERPAAFQLGGPGWPSGFIFAGVCAHRALCVDEFHGGREIRQPHVGRKNICCCGVPTAVISGGLVRKTGRVGIIQPRFPNPVCGDGANLDARVLDISAAHCIHDAALARGAGAVVIRADIFVIRELPAEASAYMI